MNKNGKETMSNGSSTRTRRALNRLLVDSYDETLALTEAADLMREPARALWLRARASRRKTFRRDLCAGVKSFDGTPADGPSLAARYWSMLRRFRTSLTGAHAGDAYAACARATAKSVLGYGDTLGLELPDDVRFGLQIQYEELEADRVELRRLRWGADPAGERHDAQVEGPALGSPNQAIGRPTPTLESPRLQPVTP